MKNFIEKIRNWYRKLPEKKIYFEVITAILSVPVMITVIILNLNNLNQNKKLPTNTNQATPVQIVITEKTQTPSSPSPTQAITPTATPSPTLTPTECKKEIGPVEILSPQEGEIISKDSVCIKLSTKAEYCPVVWSYQVNNGNWSDFTDKGICLYNLTNGEKQLQIKIKSTVSNEEITLKRNFTYTGSTIAPSPTTDISPSISQ